MDGLDICNGWDVEISDDNSDTVDISRMVDISNIVLDIWDIWDIWYARNNWDMILELRCLSYFECLR